jgi:pyruvate kinase
MIRTKIVATIGPSSNTRPKLEAMIDAGMNIARLNFSHGTYEEHGEVINTIRSLSRTMNRPIGILLDLQGPKIRTGTLRGGRPVELKKGGTIRITTRKIEDTAEMVSTTYTHLPKDVKKGDRILIDDGLIELMVLFKRKDTIKCKIISGGLLKEHKGINLPGVAVSAPSLTDKDRRDINFGIKVSVDYFALSFVRKAEDLRQVKRFIRRQGHHTPVVAKIEKPEALDNMDAILEEADAVMVARGDLGVELNPEQVPCEQKKVIAAAVRANKPVITATQMLESMCTNPIPTRAEASDVANAIFDGTDAVMLSGETASGRYPVQAVRMMAKIAAQSEGSKFMRFNLQHKKDPTDLVPQAVAQSAVNILQDLKAKGIVVFTFSGSTAQLISQKRPSKPVYAFTPSLRVYNRLSLMWGITPLYIANIDKTDRLIQASENILIDKRIARKNDIIIIVIGFGLKKGSTNVIKIHRVGRAD